MPTEQFYNLNQEKQNRITNASKEEFYTVGYEKASINQIVKKAGISRGSFYNYFNDKDDVYYFVIEKDRKQINEMLYRAISEQEGDLIRGYMVFFQRFSKLKSFNHVEIFSKIIDDILEGGFLDFVNTNASSDASNFFKRFVETIDIKKLNMKSSSDLFSIIEILTLVTMQHLKYLRIERFSETEVKKLYADQMRILQRGIYK